MLPVSTYCRSRISWCFRATPRNIPQGKPLSQRKAGWSLIHVGVLVITGVLTAMFYLLLAAWLFGFGMSIAAITIAGVVGAIAGLSTAALFSA